MLITLAATCHQLSTWIWHLECHYHLTSVLARRPWPNHPRHNLRMCLHYLFVDTHQPHTMMATWRCFIQMFCYCTKCSIYPAVIFSRWRLWEWFQHSWLTNNLYEKCHTYTTFPAWNMHLLIQHTLHLAAQLPHWNMVHHEPLQGQYTAAYHLLPTVQRVTSIQTAHQNTQRKKKKISKQYL